LQGVSESEFLRTRLQLEAREQEMDDLESKMTTGAELLADNDSRLCQLEFSLLDNSTVCVITYCFSVFLQQHYLMFLLDSETGPQWLLLVVLLLLGLWFLLLSDILIPKTFLFLN